MRLDSIISQYNATGYPHCPPADDPYWDWCSDSPNFMQVWEYLDCWGKWAAHAGKPPANYYRGIKRLSAYKRASLFCRADVHIAFEIGAVIPQPVVLQKCQEVYDGRAIRSIKFNLAELARYWCFKRKKRSEWFIELISRK